MSVSREKARLIGNFLEINWGVIPEDEFHSGINVELDEHYDVLRGDAVKAGRVARDHLQEFPDYYTRLDVLETQAKTTSRPRRSNSPAQWRVSPAQWQIICAMILIFVVVYGAYKLGARSKSGFWGGSARRQLPIQYDPAYSAPFETVNPIVLRHRIPL